ncbi:MAG: DUF4410 domain-containing protein [Geobacteraceae bacterium]|nr:DUF4410 domain-containing protein [Geobacteraceae bacterium]
MKRLHCFGLKCCGVLFGCMLLAACTTSPQILPEAPPGAQIEKDWKNLIDSFVLIHDFNVADYTKIAVARLDTSATPLPPKDENTYKPTYLVLKASSDIFLMGMKGAFMDAKYPIEPVPLEGMGKTEGKVLVIRGKVTEMNPGSRALRYWVSFGAGQSRVEISGEVADAESNAVLARFVHARSSGIGTWGGDYEKFLTDDTRDVGEDVGKMLLLFDKSRVLSAPTR